MRTFSIIYEGKPYQVIANNEDNVVEEFRNKIKAMELELSKYELYDWRFGFSCKLPKNIIARTYYDKKAIIFNTDILYLASWDIIEYAMIHEICHALSPNDGHGENWQKQCRVLGIPIIFRFPVKELKNMGEYYKLSFKRTGEIPCADNYIPNLPR